VADYRIREAICADIETLIDFTLREALDAEGATKDLDGVSRGVRSAIEDPLLATYWVAETVGGEVAGSTSVVTEWSNFHGGQYWWVQSLFIVPEHRGRGLVDLLLNHLAERAADAGALDLRLYAHSGNARAVRAYERCGFSQAPYVMMTRKLR
jgi:GNAT superfamily N-acetyltransferase